MNDNKVAFIICTNDREYLEECKFYIDNLDIPKDIQVEVIPVENAESMTMGYNRGMKLSNAKYKVYLHQDVFILNKSFIYDILECFNSDENLGMLGVAGATHIPNNAQIWSCLDIGGCYSIGTFSGLGNCAIKPKILNPAGLYQEVEYIDGMLIATSCDIPWDERIEGFHFYDAAQSISFVENGYKIAVVHQEEPWIFHDFGPLNLETYERFRQKFCTLFDKYNSNTENVEDNASIYRMCSQIANVLSVYLEENRWREIYQIYKEIDNAVYYQEDLITLRMILEIKDLEEKYGTEMFVSSLYDKCSYEILRCKYFMIKTLLIRLVFEYLSLEETIEQFIEQDVSIWAIIVVFLHNIPSEYNRKLYDMGEVLLQDEAVWASCINAVKVYEKEQLPSAEGL